MIVSCESCKSRYKLDDSKITGRGAKITCPKCKHVFVVLAPPSAIQDSPRPAMLPQTAAGNEWEDDEPTRVGRESAAAALAAPAAAPKPSVPPAAAPAALPAAAPATNAPEHEVIRPRSAAAPAPAAPPAPKESAATRAAALDFRKVGVTAWKVKVRIGLVYDFSDIKTLRKYIQDGRVTSADVISHDGKAWKPIGDIPDLDQFFVESYEALEKEYAGKAPPERNAQPTPADLGNVAAALAAAAAAELDGPSRSGRPEPTGPTYTDPFEAMKQRQRGPAKKSGPKGAQENKTVTYAVVGLLFLVALAVGGWFFTHNKGGNVVVTPPPGKSTTAAPSRKEPVFHDVAPPSITPEQVDPGGASGGTPSGGVTEPARVDDCPKIVQGKCVTEAVGPHPGGPGTGPGGGSSPEKVPSGGGSGPQASAIHNVATDNMAVGEDFMKAKDYNSAVQAFSAAVSEGKGGASVRLGEAQWRAGDQASGGYTLTSAAAGSAKAWKVLGQLKEESGDKAGAKDAYSSYLKSNPKDAAAIKARVDALGG